MTSPSKKFDIPEQIIVDLTHGYAINIPLENQGFKSMLDVPGDVLESIKEARKEFGLVIDDFPSPIEFPAVD